MATIKTISQQFIIYKIEENGTHYAQFLNQAVTYLKTVFYHFTFLKPYYGKFYNRFSTFYYI